MNDFLLPISILCLVILVLIVLLKRLSQPYPIAYLLAGVLLGPGLTRVFTKPEAISQLGEFGILLLMFFLGLEIDVPGRKDILLKPVIIQTAKTLLTLAFCTAVGYSLGWKPAYIAVFSALLIFNSTAVVSEVLRQNGEIRRGMGRLVLNVLLLQDVIVAPALTALNSAGTNNDTRINLFVSAGVCILFGFLLRAVRNRNLFQWPVWSSMEKDHDLQVFAGTLICLGFAWLAVIAGLSAPLGSFAAGIYLGRTSAFDWLGQVLHPFRVFFVALFFVSIGLSIDLSFLFQRYPLIIFISVLVLLLNSLITAIVFRVMNYSWAASLYAGGLLSGTGEFGFLVIAVARKAAIISEDFFKIAMSVVSITLLLSTIWIGLTRKIAFSDKLIPIAKPQTE